MSIKIQQLEAIACDYAECFNALRDSVESLNWEIQDLKAQHLQEIREKVGQVKSTQSQLKKAINECQGCFDKPKTLIFHGIKVGWQKKKGTINFATNSIELIEKKLPKQAQSLIVIKKTISKTVAAKLSIQDAKKIGAEIIKDRDEPVIKSVDSNVEKLVSQLLKEDKDIEL